MREIKNALQHKDENSRRWFNDPQADLFIWNDERGISAFEYCFGLPYHEQVLRWNRNNGIEAFNIDAGETNPMKNSSPILTEPKPLKAYRLLRVLEHFRRHAAGIEQPIYQFVLTTLEKGWNRAKHNFEPDRQTG